MTVRVAHAVAAALLLGTSLVLGGCASDQERYCDAVADHQTELSDLAAGGGADDLFAAAEVYRDLAEEAPRDIRDEWDLVLDRIDDLRHALDDAGLDPAGIGEDDDADLPPEVTRAARRLDDAEAARAMGDLQQQALDVCRTPLSR